MMPRNSLVQRRTRQLGAAVRAPRLAVLGQRDEKESALHRVERARPLIRGQRNQRSQKVRRRHDVEHRVGHGHQLARDREVPRGIHRLAILRRARLGTRNVHAQPRRDLLPMRARIDLGADLLELRDRARAQPLAEAHELIRVVGDHVRRVQLPVEELASDREVIARARLHLLERQRKRVERLRSRACARAPSRARRPSRDRAPDRRAHPG